MQQVRTSSPVIVSSSASPSSFDARSCRPLIPSKKRSRQLQGINTNRPASAPVSELSASIPLPKSHIRRTPSELQLADDVRRAEYEDVRMYSRLVVGMQCQCLVRGYVHPLTQKSLQDILKTKQADEDELDHNKPHEGQGDDGAAPNFGHYHHLQDVHEESHDECWDTVSRGSVDSPLPCQPMGSTDKGPTFVKTPSDLSIASAGGEGGATTSTGVAMPTSPADGQQQESREDPEEEDECVFSLEL